MARILWSPAGRQSLVDVAQSVVEQSESLETGIKLIDAIEAKCKTYAQFPERGFPVMIWAKDDAALSSAVTS